VAILLLARTTVEKIQILVVLVTHIVAVAWVGAIVVPKEIAVELIVLRPLRQLLRQPSVKNGLVHQEGGVIGYFIICPVRAANLSQKIFLELERRR